MALYAPLWKRSHHSGEAAFGGFPTVVECITMDRRLHTRYPREILINYYVTQIGCFYSNQSEDVFVEKGRVISAPAKSARQHDQSGKDPSIPIIHQQPVLRVSSQALSHPPQPFVIKCPLKTNSHMHGNVSKVRKYKKLLIISLLFPY